MNRSTLRKHKRRVYDPEALQRELYNRSIVLTRSAHALSTAAEQLLRAHGRDVTRSAVDVRTAALSAMIAAVNAYELVGGYDLAGWLERRSRAAED